MSEPKKSPPLVFPTPQPGRVWVRSARDGDVSLPYDQLVPATKIDPNLQVIGVGANAELQKRIDECRDSGELALLMAEARKGRI